MKKIIISFLVITCSLFLYESLIAYSDGITGRTKKQGGLGCSCHGTSPTASVSVIISGPASVAANDTATYTLRLFGGPLVAGGCDIAAQNGTLATSYLEPLLHLSGSELTHNSPKLSVGGDTIKWYFKYKAPNTIAQFDTLYANGNSVNNTGGSSGDAWNFASNFKIFITAGPIAVTQTSEVVNGYNLSQNYPNPFNPSTKINYSITKSGFVSLKVYNLLGKEVAALVSQVQAKGNYEVTLDASTYNLSSGIYYYSIVTPGFSKTMKMSLVK